MPGEISQYERIRLKNIQDNKKILAELGLKNPFGPLPRVVKKVVKRSRPRPSTDGAGPPAKRQKIDTEGDDKDYGSIRGTRRRSARVKGVAAKTEDELKDEVENEEDEDYTPRKRVPAGRVNSFGPIPGVEVGVQYETRMESCIEGIHRPTVAGIHGGPEGAYSIALSGGYEDDIDMGECFTYTGQGGRDLKGTSMKPKNLRTAPQSKDQTLSHGNLALSKNAENGNPVRVIRGYKLDSPYAPEWGYRYDGLYTVEKSWFTTGMSGFGVWKFALRRMKDQAPPPWTYDEKQSKDDKESQDSGVVSDQSDAGSVGDEKEKKEEIKEGENKQEAGAEEKTSAPEEKADESAPEEKADEMGKDEEVDEKMEESSEKEIEEEKSEKTVESSEETEELSEKVEENSEKMEELTEKDTEKDIEKTKSDDIPKVDENGNVEKEKFEDTNNNENEIFNKNSMNEIQC